MKSAVLSKKAEGTDFFKLGRSKLKKNDLYLKGYVFYILNVHSFHAGVGKNNKNFLLILDEAALLQAEIRTMESGPQSFQADHTDQSFSCLRVYLRVIILNSMLPFSLHTERKHPVPGTESDVARFCFQPYRCHSDCGHKGTMTGL